MLSHPDWSRLPTVPWQRCQFHLQQNAQAYVSRLDQRNPVAQRIKAIFNASDKAEAERLLKQAVELWTKEAPKLALWAEENLPMAFTVFDLPVAHRTRLRTTNGLERINRELKRRTRVASIFPNTAAPAAGVRSARRMRRGVTMAVRMSRSVPKTSIVIRLRIRQMRMRKYPGES